MADHIIQIIFVVKYYLFGSRHGKILPLYEIVGFIGRNIHGVAVAKADINANRTDVVAGGDCRQGVGRRQGAAQKIKGEKLRE